MFEQRGYLLDITCREPNRMAGQELVDNLARYRYNELFFLTERPPTVDLARYCEMQGIAFKTLDRFAADQLMFAADTITVPTCAGHSLAGRIEEMRERMIAAERQGRLQNRHRFLVTDLTDGYEWHPPIVSLPAIVMGGAFASQGAKSANMDLERELDSVLGAPLAKYLLKLGTLYLRGGAMRDGASEYFNILSGDCGYSRHPGITDFVLDEVSGIVHGVRIAAERWIERCPHAEEIAYAASLLDAACHRRDESRLRAIRDDHGRLWRKLSAPEGRVESLAKLPRF